MHIRAMKLSDCEGVGSVHVRSWRRAYSEILPKDYLDHLDAAASAKKCRIGFEVNADVLRFVAAENSEVVGFVMGLPLNMDGTAGPRVQASRTYARSIRNVSPLPVLFWDERLSTFEAERALIAADMSREKRAAVIDATAAAVILQRALDALA